MSIREKCCGLHLKPLGIVVRSPMVELLLPLCQWLALRCQSPVLSCSRPRKACRSHHRAGMPNRGSIKSLCLLISAGSLPVLSNRSYVALRHMFGNAWCWLMHNSASTVLSLSYHMTYVLTRTRQTIARAWSRMSIAFCAAGNVTRAPLART